MMQMRAFSGCWARCNQGQPGRCALVSSVSAARPGPKGRRDLARSTNMMQICKVASLEVTSTPRGDDEYAQQESAEALAQHSVPAPSASPAPPVIVTDDLDALLEVLPADLGGALVEHPLRSQLVEVVLDLGRRPEARFQVAEPEYLREHTVTREELDAAAAAVAPFGTDNRAGIAGTLHRISALRSRSGSVVGLTCRVGRAVSGHVGMARDLLEANVPLLFLGRPGVGKTTAIREMSRTLADELAQRVVIVDTSNEIGGDGDVPHAAIGGARRMQVPCAAQQHRVMIEAVENHMPQVVVVDEVGTEAEATACRTIAERGVTLIATAHGCFIENLVKNPTLADLVGGVASVTLGDEEARARGCQKSVLQRRGPPTFPVVIEMRDRGAWVAHDTAASVDALLAGRVPKVQLRLRGEDDAVEIHEVAYDQVEAQILAQLAGASSPASSPTASGDDLSVAAAVAANAAGIDSLVAAVLRGQGVTNAASGAPGSSTGSSSLAGSLDDLALPGLEPGVLLERFKGLTEEEALQELRVLRYVGGQAGLLRRPGGSSGFAGGISGGAGAAAAAASAGGGSRKKRRAVRAKATRGSSR